MNFRTILPESKNDLALNLGQKVVLYGSCFATHIGEKLEAIKMNTGGNSHGIVYNPISIFQSIEEVVGKRTFTSEDLFQFNGLWHSNTHHGCFSGVEAKQVLGNINASIMAAHQALKEGDCLFVSLGTSFVYKETSSGVVVANCHKRPKKMFSNSLLEVEDVVSAFQKAIQPLKRINPNIKIVFTVSPIRHLKLGFVENTQSKAILIESVRQICKQNKACYYFPSYELLMDDLRDYRFYEKDMVHPRQEAIDYIWDYFKKVYFQKEDLLKIAGLENFQKLLQHRPLFPETENFKQFVALAKQKLTALQIEYPEKSWEKESKILQQWGN